MPLYSTSGSDVMKPSLHNLVETASHRLYITKLPTGNTEADLGDDAGDTEDSEEWTSRRHTNGIASGVRKRGHRRSNSHGSNRSGQPMAPERHDAFGQARFCSRDIELACSSIEVVGHSLVFLPKEIL